MYLIYLYYFRVSITSLEHQEFNTHPYYTFCPEWMERKDERDMQPGDFIVSSNL